MIAKCLNAMPIEAHGGRKYTDMGIMQAARFLEGGISLNIFPEGAYIPDDRVFRGHTGASRIMYSALQSGKHINLVPVSIKTDRTDDLDCYDKTGDNVIVSFLPPVDVSDAYYNYMHAENNEQRNIWLHEPIDTAMQWIASSLGVPYVNEYIPLYPKGNVMFEGGSVVDTTLAQKDEYVQRYNAELDGRVLSLMRSLK